METPRAPRKSVLSLTPTGAVMIGSERWLKFYRHVVDGAVEHCISQHGIADADKPTAKDLILQTFEKGVFKPRHSQHKKFNVQAVYKAVCNALGHVLGKGNDDPPHLVDEYIQRVEEVCDKKGRSKEFIKAAIEKNTSFQRLLEVAKGHTPVEYFDIAIEDEGGVGAVNSPDHQEPVQEPSSHTASPVFPTPLAAMPLHTVASGAPHVTVHMKAVRGLVEHTGDGFKHPYQPSNVALHADSAGPSNRTQPPENFLLPRKLPVTQGTSPQHNTEVVNKKSPGNATDKHSDAGNAKPSEPKRPTCRRSGPKFKLPTAASASKSGESHAQITPPNRSSALEIPVKPGQPSPVLPTSPAIKKRTAIGTLRDAESKRIRNEKDVDKMLALYKDKELPREAPQQAAPSPAETEKTSQEQAVPQQAEDELQKLRANCGAMQRFIDSHQLHADLFKFLVPYMISDCGAAAKKLEEAMKAYIQQSAYHHDFAG